MNKITRPVLISTHYLALKGHWAIDWDSCGSAHIGVSKSILPPLN